MITLGKNRKKKTQLIFLIIYSMGVQMIPGRSIKKTPYPGCWRETFCLDGTYAQRECGRNVQDKVYIGTETAGH